VHLRSANKPKKQNCKSHFLESSRAWWTARNSFSHIDYFVKNAFTLQFGLIVMLVLLIVKLDFFNRALEGLVDWGCKHSVIF